MKPYLFSKGMMGLVVGCLLLAPGAYAAPERIVIKKESVRAKENVAKDSLKRLDLQQIDDPDARQAIREILSYLNLQTKS
jgi:hypothetical protein